MHAVRWPARLVSSLLAVIALAVGLAAASAAPVAASAGGASARSASARGESVRGESAAGDSARGESSSKGGTGGCDPYVDGTVIPVPCSSGSGNGGSGGGGGTTVNNSCTTTVLDKAQAQSLGLSWPPPQGESWALLDCLGGATGATPQAVLVSNATGAPAVTPQQLLVTALGELRIPYLGPATAPPRGHDGLVGLPEWFWISAGSWHARNVTVTAGPVWASVTAAPVGLTFAPGTGISPVSCAGPGTAYDPREPAAAQHTDCSYTYLQPSTGQPDDAYQASVTVTWRVSWSGSGGVGGVLDAALSVPVDFTVPVAQGEALVTSP